LPGWIVPSGIVPDPSGALELARGQLSDIWMATGQKIRKVLS